MKDTKLVTKEEVDGFLGIDTQINVSDKPLEEAIEIIADIVNGEYTIDQLRRDIHEWKETWTVITPKERPAPYAAMSPFESKEELRQRAMEANVARTEISGKYNTKWTPDAKRIHRES
jgi:hypothetical protein